MARNLRDKMPENDSLTVHDIDKSVVAKFVEESSGHAPRVQAGRDVKDVADRSVSSTQHLPGF